MIYDIYPNFSSLLLNDGIDSILVEDSSLLTPEVFFKAKPLILLLLLVIAADGRKNLEVSPKHGFQDILVSIKVDIWRQVFDADRKVGHFDTLLFELVDVLLLSEFEDNREYVETQNRRKVKADQPYAELFFGEFNIQHWHHVRRRFALRKQHNFLAIAQITIRSGPAFEKRLKGIEAYLARLLILAFLVKLCQ